MASVPGKFLNMENIIKKVFDETSDSLRTSVSGASSIIIDAADDSIAIGDRNTGNLASVNANGGLNTNLVGVTPVAGRVPVDIGGATVNITGDVVVTNEVEVKNDVGNPIPVSGTVVVTGVATLTEQQTQTTILSAIDSKLANPLTVTATNLDVRDLVFATDKVDVTGSTVSVSNTLTVNLPTNASTLTEQQAQTTKLNTIDSSLVSIDTNISDIELIATDIYTQSLNQTALQTDILNKLNAGITVSATDLDIRNLTFLQDKVDVTGSSVSVTNFPATQTVIATDLDIRNLTFSQDKVDVSGSVVALDSTTLAALEDINVTVQNFPANQNVTIQNLSLPVTQSGTWNINDITGTVSLPTGAATAANQSTINTTLGTISTNQLSGSQKSIVRGGQKGTTVAGDVTSTNINADRQALDVAVKEDLPLTFADDKVDATGSTVELGATTLAALENINVTVDNQITTARVSLTSNAPTGVTVGTTSVSVLASNASRKGAVIINTTNKTISLAVGTAAILNSGITLLPGGTWVMDEFTFTTGELFAISSNTGGNLSIQEFQ